MLIYKVWARIEVYDPEEDEHYDLNPEIAELKVGEFNKVEDVAAFVSECWDANDQEKVIEEILFARQEALNERTR